MPGFLGILISLIFVAINGFFVAAEFAIVKVRRTRLEELVGQGVREARISILITEELDEYLSATPLGVTLASLALGWIGEPAFAQLFGHHFPAVVVSFLLITLLHVVLGELVPK